MRDCPLCSEIALPIYWQDDFCRVVLVDEPDYPGYFRVELIEHLKEMTDLAPASRSIIMRIVFAVEAAIREVLKPDKVNLASLGNMTPHVHWHVVPRFKEDKHFPQSHWAQPVRDVAPKLLTPEQTMQLQSKMPAFIESTLTED